MFYETWRDGTRHLRTWVVLVLLLCLVVGIGGLAWRVVDWAWDTDVKNARTHCATLGAEPHFTEDTHYLCVDAEGRIVGSG